jgi:EmrB/QacA subfamily drug resistance transporter
MSDIMHPRLDAEIKNKHNRPWIVFAVMLASFLGGLDATVVGTAMPTIVSDLGGLHFYSWVFSAYMLATAVFMPLFGKFSDLFGKKRTFFWAAGFFLVGSGLSGIAGAMWQLVVFRAIQGIGAGGAGIVSMAIIASLYPPQHRARAMGFISSVWGISSVVGPILGSLIVSHLGWRWVFYVNLPFGFISMLLLTAVYHERRQVEKKQVDYRGALSLTLAILVLLIAFARIGKGESILAWHIVLMMIIVLLLMIYFFRRERSFGEPLLPLHLFRQRVFTLANICGFLSGFTIFGITAFLPLFVQAIKGGTVMDAGYAVMATSLGWSLAGIGSGQIVHRFGEKKIIFLGIVMMGIGLIIAAQLTSVSSTLMIELAALSIGIGMGIQTPALMTAVQNSVNPSNIGVATSTHMLGRTIGGAIGVSMMGAALMNSLQVRIRILEAAGILNNLPPLLRSKLSDPQELLGMHLGKYIHGEDLRTILEAFSASLQNAFLTGLLMVVVSLIVWFAFPKIFPHHEQYSIPPNK